MNGTLIRMNSRLATTYGVKLYELATSICAARTASTAPSTEIRPTSFCIEMKSFISAGVTLRNACGITTSQVVCPAVRPSERAEARCEGCTSLKPARSTSAT